LAIGFQTITAMSKSLLEQLPEIAAYGRQQTEGILGSREGRYRMARKNHAGMDDVGNAAARQEAPRNLAGCTSGVSGKERTGESGESGAVQMSSAVRMDGRGYPMACFQTRLQHRVKVWRRAYKTKAPCVAEPLWCGVVAR